MSRATLVTCQLPGPIRGKIHFSVATASANVLVTYKTTTLTCVNRYYITSAVDMALLTNDKNNNHKLAKCLCSWIYLTILYQLLMWDMLLNRGVIWKIKWKGYGRKRLFIVLRYHPSLFLERLRKSTKDSGPPGRICILGFGDNFSDIF